MHTKKKDLVLSLAHRYKWRDLSIFVNSLERSGFKGDVVIFSSRLDRQTIATLKSKGVTVRQVFLPLFKLKNVFLLPGWKPYRWLFSVIPSFRIRRALGKLVFNIMCARFAHFQHYLERNLHLYDKVLIADVRDVCFQTDPFTNDSGYAITSFLEESPIRESRANYKWLRQAYGENAKPEILDYTSCCAGVTIGKADVILNYLTQMLEELCHVELMTPVAGVDQAVHNFLFHGKRLPESGTLPNGNPICMTMGAGVPYTLNDRLEVMADDTVISILHQYDRHPELNRIMKERYEEKNATAEG